MSFIECVNEKVKAGILSKKELQSLEAEFENYKEKYTKTMGDSQAATQAARHLVDIKKEKLAGLKRNKLKSAVVQANLKQGLTKVASDNNKPINKVINSFYQRVAHRKNSILKDMMKGMDEVASKFGNKWAGLKRGDDGMIDVLFEMMGTKTDDPQAARMAKSTRWVYDYAAGRFKSAGGIMGHLENYTPNIDNADLIKKAASFDEWYEFKLDTLDLERIIDTDTGLPFDADKLRGIMKEDFDNIVTDGRSGIQASVGKNGEMYGHGAEVSQSRMASRFYHYKDAAHFKKYNDKYGVGDRGLFEAMFGQFELFARDIALLEEMGPMPNATARMFDEMLAESGASDKVRKMTNGIYNVVNGYVDTNAGHNLLTQSVANLQNIFSAAYLGSASVSALGDVAYMASSSHIYGMKATKVLQNYAKLMNPANPEHRKIMKQIGYIVDNVRAQTLSDVRFTGENMGGPATQFFSQFTNRASGLHYMTKAAGDATSMATHTTLGDLSVKKASWESIDDSLREALEAHDITKADWELMKKADIFEPQEGSYWLTKENISAVKDVTEGDIIKARAEVDYQMRQSVIDDLSVKEVGDLKVSELEISEELSKRKKSTNMEAEYQKRADKLAFKRSMEVSDKLGIFIEGFRAHATNEPTVMAKAITTGAYMGDARRGTYNRLLHSSVMQFKSFSVAVMMNHIAPIFTGRRPHALGGKLSKEVRIKHLLNMAFGTSLMGAVALQMEQMVKGKDFMDMDPENWKFWGAAYMKSGGMGLLGDFAFKDYSRFGRSATTEMLGPTFGFVDDFMRTLKGSIDRSLEDGDEGAAWDAFKRNSFQLLRRNIPAQNLWYLRTVLDRGIFNQVESLIDPRFEERMQRQASKMMQETGQKYYWSRGEMAPDRGPEMAERPEQ